MNFLERQNNIYVVDTKMFGFDHYNAAYIVEGKEIALVDTGTSSQTEAVLAGIKAHGFSISDISYIFVTHEHPDHIGNVARFLRESPGAYVYIHPMTAECMIDPAVEKAKAAKRLPPELHSKLEFWEIEPVPESRIKCLNNGDEFDLGNGEKLKIYFAPGHAPGGIAIYEEKNKGLFISDLVGNYLADADAHYTLNPAGSDHLQAIKSIEKLMELPVDYLYLGHYGIVDKPKEIMARAIKNMQQFLDIGMECIRQGKPELIADKAYEATLPELEKILPARGEEAYNYAAKEHVSRQMRIFASYCQERFKK